MDQLVLDDSGLNRVLSKVKSYIGDWTTTTLQASGWSNSQYNLESAYPSSTYDILDVELTESATTEQRNAWAKADCGGYYTSNIIRANGTVPAVNIPVALLIRTK